HRRIPRTRVRRSETTSHLRRGRNPRRRLMEAEYVALYRDLYRNHWWWRVRERILLSTIERLIEVPPVRILDVGCGDGLFFDALQRFGDVTGIEADETTLGERNPWADRIVVGELDESFVPRDAFDLVLMLDVIEHVSD